LAQNIVRATVVTAISISVLPAAVSIEQTAVAGSQSQGESTGCKHAGSQTGIAGTDTTTKGTNEKPCLAKGLCVQGFTWSE
jgi:hypothetical protein